MLLNVRGKWRPRCGPRSVPEDTCTHWADQCRYRSFTISTKRGPSASTARYVPVDLYEIRLTFVDPKIHRSFRGRSTSFILDTNGLSGWLLLLLCIVTGCACYRYFVGITSMILPYGLT